MKTLSMNDKRNNNFSNTNSIQTTKYTGMNRNNYITTENVLNETLTTIANEGDKSILRQYEATKSEMMNCATTVGSTLAGIDNLRLNSSLSDTRYSSTISARSYMVSTNMDHVVDQEGVGWGGDETMWDPSDDNDQMEMSV